MDRPTLTLHGRGIKRHITVLVASRTKRLSLGHKDIVRRKEIFIKVQRLNITMLKVHTTFGLPINGLLSSGRRQSLIYDNQHEHRTNETSQSSCYHISGPAINKLFFGWSSF